MADPLGLIEDLPEQKTPDVFGLTADLPDKIATKTWEDVKGNIVPNTTLPEQTKIKNAMAISATHDIPFDAAYNTEPEFVKKFNRPNLLESTGRSFVAGVGDMYVNLGNVMKWGKVPTFGIADTWIDYGKKMQNMYVAESDKEFSWKDFLDPVFYSTKVTRSVPSTLSLIPAALIGSEIGIGIGGVVAGRTLGAFAKTVLGSIGAATLSRPIESAMEASGTYQQALDAGKTDEEATSAANEVFKGNMTLAGLDAVQFFTSFMPLKFNTNILALRVLSSAGKVAGVSAIEGAEERYQQVIQEMAANPDAKLKDFFDFDNPNLNEATAIGALFGAGLGGVGSVYESFTSKVVENLTPETKTVYEETVKEGKDSGLTSEEATKKALDEIASTPEGEKEIKDAVEIIKEQAENIAEKATTKPQEQQVEIEKPVEAENITETDIDNFVEEEIQQTEISGEVPSPQLLSQTGEVTEKPSPGKEEIPVIKITTPETQGAKTIKSRIRQTTGQATLSNMVREDKALKAAFEKATKAAREAFRAGNKEGVAAEKVKMRNLLDRAKKIRAVQEFFGLTQADMKKVSRKNPLLMSQYEFKLYLDDVRQKALELREEKNAKIALKELIRRKDLKKVEYLQRALKYPTIDKMNIDQLNSFFDILEKYQQGDVFLSQRRLEVVDRTDLKGIKTWREAKEALAKEASELIGRPVTVEELSEIKVDPLDRFRYDSALIERNPFYKMVVTEMHRELLNAEMEFHNVKQETFRLAKAAEKSRPQTFIHRFIPQNKLIMGYIEAAAEQKQAYLSQMTNEEINYAHFIETYFKEFLKYLIETQSLQQGRENYFVHMRQRFLENVKEEGLLTAFKNIFKNYKEDEVSFTILDEDTGNILPFEKFFPFSLHRTGALLPTFNVTEAFLAYVKIAERKKAFDRIISKLDIYAQSITPQKLTPRGLEMDRTMKRFVNQYINNKKGRHIDQLVGKQGGAVDLGLRAVRSLTSLLDLGFNIPVGITAFIGEQITNFVQLGTTNMAKGASRAFTEHGKAIIDKYEAIIGRSPWENFTAPGKGLIEKIHEGLFVGFHESARIANINFLLGMMTEEEFTSETISDKRLAELQLEMGRMRVVPGSKSLVGSTSLGSVFTQYKTWAVPILSTIKGDITTLVSDLINKPTTDALTTKQARELYRIVGLSATIIITGAVLAGDDDDNDKDFSGSLLRKAYRESLSLIGAIDPTLWTPIRTISFMTDLAKNLKSIALLEEYKNKEGLKGVEGLGRQLTPKAIKQFIPKEEKFKP